MDENTIWENISRQLAGEASPSQKEQVNEWKNLNTRNRKLVMGITEVWNARPQDTYKNDRIYHKFQARKNNYRNSSATSHFVYYALRVAAILFFVVGIAAVSRYLLFPHSFQPMAYQEISVPKGNRTSVILPDGTKAWITNHSSLKYPNTFSGKNRQVELTGEAYFEVTHDEKHPFIVNIGKSRIKVLGTKFSVCAYPEDKEIKADLVSGKIQFDVYDSSVNDFKTFLIKPGQSLTFNKTTRVVNESKITGDFYDYWHKGIYTFKDESLESLAAKIERIYNAEVVFEDEYLRTKRYSGSFSVNDNIFTFIEAIKQTSVEPINYRFTGNKLYLSRN